MGWLRLKQQKRWIVLTACGVGLAVAVFSIVRLPAGLFMLMSRAEPRLPLPQWVGGCAPEDCRAIYRQAHQWAEQGDYDHAVMQYEKLETIYPGLLDIILYRKGEAATKIPNEKVAQDSFERLVGLGKQTVLFPQALYQLGQSYVRGGQTELAEKTFQRLLALDPQGNYAIGARYYLGTLALQRHDSATALGYWRAYLDLSSDGTFADDVSRQLPSLLPNKKLDSDDSRRVGLAWSYQSGGCHQALSYFAQTNFAAVWQREGMCLVWSGQHAAGIQRLVEGMRYAKSQEEVQQALDFIAAQEPDGLKKIAPQSLTVGRDYLYWRLAKQTPETAHAYYQQLLAEFPNSDYAPESSWHEMWRHYVAGQTEVFVAMAQQHLQRYPTSRSVPRVMYWWGKAKERSNQAQEALSAYTQLTAEYPYDYYAFRARNRLAVLKESQRDEGWHLISASYPSVDPPPIQWQELPHLVPMLSPSIQELFAIGVPEDVQLWADARYGKTIPAMLKSFLAAESGQTALSIKTFREGLLKKEIAPNQVTSSELKLFYPLSFRSDVLRHAQTTGVNPYLIQALMREESYFNPLAVSGSQAMGLMQLLPATAAGVAKTVGLPNFHATDLFQPDTNVQLGSHYLAYLLQTFQNNAMEAVGAYNGGPNAMKRWVAQSSADPDQFIESLPAAESREYIKKVFNSYWMYRMLYHE